jgi:hypothetical protein
MQIHIFNHHIITNTKYSVDNNQRVLYYMSDKLTSISFWDAHHWNYVI